jgi:hypothetical protein
LKLIEHFPKWLTDNVSLAILFLQLILTILTGYIALYQLRKEFRKHAEINKTEARAVQSLIIIFTTLTVLVQLIGFISNEKSQQTVNYNFDTLKLNYKSLSIKNDNLESAVINEVDSNTANVVYQASRNAIKANSDLSATAHNISNLIKGSDSIPEFTIQLGNKLIVTYTNKSSLPIYNLEIKTINYDTLKNCRIDTYSGLPHINEDCIQKATKEDAYPYVLPGSTITLNFQSITSDNKNGRMEIFCHIGNKYYAQQIAFIKLTPRFRAYRYRTLLSTDGIKYRQIYEWGHKSIFVKWNEAFTTPFGLIFSND